jgi:hypothetical protein
VTGKETSHLAPPCGSDCSNAVVFEIIGNKVSYSWIVFDHKAYGRRHVFRTPALMTMQAAVTEDVGLDD